MNNDIVGKLYLIPTTLGSFETNERVLPSYNTQIIHGLDVFIVEQLRTARRFLSSLRHPTKIDDLTFKELNKHSITSEIDSYLDCTYFGTSVGLLSEAGTPCVADPGAVIVKLAQERGIQVIPLVGPNSIILALMASGFNGQNFAFHGYLPVDKHQLGKKLKELEIAANKANQTQIFIETPYRNNQVLASILNSCSKNTLLCIATDLTLPSESIQTMPISMWKKIKPDFHKKPTVFLIYK